MDYFKYFPKIEYCDNNVVNLLARNKIIDRLKSNIYAYYEYAVKDYERPDILANTYYGHYKYTWLIFYANNIFDPIREWVLSENDFNKYINSRFEETNYSFVWEMNKTYYNNDTVIYNNMIFICITESVSSIVTPNLDTTNWKLLSETPRLGQQIANQLIHEYRNRKNLIIDWDSWYYDVVTEINNYAIQSNFDWTQYNTNTQVIRTINQNDAIYHINVIPYSYESEGQIKYAAMFFKSNITINLNKRFNPNQIAFTISSNDSKRPISEYTYEWELNESRRHIKLIDPAYIADIVQEFKSLFGNI